MGFSSGVFGLRLQALLAMCSPRGGWIWVSWSACTGRQSPRGGVLKMKIQPYGMETPLRALWTMSEVRLGGQPGRFIQLARKTTTSLEKNPVPLPSSSKQGEGGCDPTALPALSLNVPSLLVHGSFSRGWGLAAGPPPVPTLTSSTK